MCARIQARISQDVAGRKRCLRREMQCRPVFTVACVCITRALLVRGGAGPLSCSAGGEDAATCE